MLSSIARLVDAKTLLERQFIHFGSDYQAPGSSSNAERLVWREIDTAFKNRILTGAVINADYIEPRQFLKDTDDVMLKRMQDISRRGKVRIRVPEGGAGRGVFRRARGMTSRRRERCFGDHYQESSALPR